MIAVTTTALYGSEDDDTVTEVVDVTRTRVIVREHPKTGKPYVSVVSIDEPIPNGPFGAHGRAVKRPDYRMLDPNVKEGQIPYEGPFSDRRKVTLFAATLMTAGAVGGAVGIAAAPAATGAGAAGGGGYLAAGAAVTGAGLTGAQLATKENPEDEEFTREAKSELDLASVREAGKT